MGTFLKFGCVGHMRTTLEKAEFRDGKENEHTWEFVVLLESNF